MPFSENHLHEFLDSLASATPAPGGGTAAALAGAMGAALVAMVARLTQNKKGYEDAQSEMPPTIEQAEKLRGTLTALMDADSAAYNSVMSALKMPHETDAQKTVRTQALQDAYKRAAQTPFEIASACVSVLELAHIVAAKGNKNAASDAGAAALLAEAGMRAGILNVEINLKAIHDETFTREMSERISHLANRRAGLIEILRLVESRM